MLGLKPESSSVHISKGEEKCLELREQDEQRNEIQHGPPETL